jgi:lysophospholipase L1-like esterase
LRKNFQKVKLFSVLLFVLFALKGFGQSGIKKTSVHSDGPIIDTSKNYFLNIQHNNNWKLFRRKMLQLKSDPASKVVIAHIGDSHIQGGYITNTIRTLLNGEYGVSSRGFVFPYALVNANGPEDVKYTYTKQWTGQKFNYKPGSEKTGITGYTLWMNNSHADLDAYLRRGSDTLYPFNEIVVYHNCPYIQISSKPEAERIVYNSKDNLYSTRLSFRSYMDTIHLRISASDTTKQRPAVYGIDLLSKKHGIVYNAFGANGSTYESFFRAIEYMPFLKLQHPDCVIVSLGTNDAYNKYVDTTQLKSRILLMIDNIKKELPEACIILTTPGDHLRQKKYPNPNLVKVRATIVSCAKQRNCAYWDFFQVMGGLYASKKWQKNGLMYKDIIHLSKEGYKLQGELFFEAFRKAINGVGN